jgi:hypothetical protein
MVRQSSSRAERTRARHAAVHALLDQGVGLLECARRLGWALNTVKRYARAATAEDLQRPAQYRETLVDRYRDHLRRRLAQVPGMAVTRLLTEIRELGYPGSANLLVRYLKQGRASTTGRSAGAGLIGAGPLWLPRMEVRGWSSRRAGLANHAPGTAQRTPAGVSSAARHSSTNWWARTCSESRRMPGLLPG